MIRVKRAARQLVKKVRELADVGRRARVAGDVARDAGRWTEAADHYRAYLNTRPDDFGVWVQLGHAYKEAGRLHEAAEAYAGAARLDDRNADLLLSRGHLAKLRGAYAEAAGFYHLSYSIDGGRHAVRELLDPAVQRHMIGAPADRLPSKIGAIDGLADMVLSGWAACDRAGAMPEIEVLLDGQVIARDRVFYRRTDLIQKGKSVGLGFRIDLSGLIDLADEPVLWVRNAETHEGLENAPFVAKVGCAAQDWIQRHVRMGEAERTLSRTRMATETAGRTLSIIMPLDGSRCEWLSEAIDSVLGQWCENWILVLVRDSSTPEEVAILADDYASRDRRVTVVDRTDGDDRAGSINAGLAAASSDYVLILTRGAILEPEAVYRYLDATRSDPDLIYADEAVTGPSSAGVERLICRPAFSPEYFRSYPYFAEAVCVRRALAIEVGGFDRGAGSALAVDFIFRIIEAANDVAHVPALLYRRRSVSRAVAAEAQPAVRAALESHLRRLGRSATVSVGAYPEVHDIDYADDPAGTVIIIPTKDRLDLLKPCIESILATTARETTRIVVIDHESKEPRTKAYLKSMTGVIEVMPYSGPFNFSRMNNLAADKFASEAKYIVFMNNDVEATSAGWLERMRGLASQDAIGAVGATLLYEDGTVQHAGVVLGEGVPADHAHKKAVYRKFDQPCPGLEYALVSNREYSAVTAACLMVPSRHFFGVGGFDEDLQIGFNDTDLCLRLRSLGLLVINAGPVSLLHRESATRKATDQIKHPEDGRRFMERWATFLSQGDPFYNPLLSRNLDHLLVDPSNVSKPVRVRPARPPIAPYESGRPRRVPLALRAP